MAVPQRSPLFVRQQKGGMFAIVNETAITGNIFFVDSGQTTTGADTAGFGQNPDKPFLTIDFAIGQCTASNGDHIFVMPGHAETLSAAADIEFDVVGVTCIGMGTGTDRPTITLGTDVAADINIGAANVTIKNIVFIADIDNLTAPIDVNAAHFTIEDCDFRDDTAAKQTARWILGDAAADWMTVRNCSHHGSDTAGAVAFVTLNGADHVRVEDCTSHGDFSAANVEVITAACTDLLITRNHLENANAVDVCIELFAACTGWVSYNAMLIATNAQVTWINTPGSAVLIENYGANLGGEAGILAGTPSV